MKNLCVLLFCSILISCSSLPEKIAVENKDALVSYDAVLTNGTELFENGQVLWGGVVVNIENRTDHSMLEIAEYQVSSSGRPRIDYVESKGRFRAIVEGFVDPTIYKSGKAVTVRGALTGTEDAKIGEFDYAFPVVKVDGLQLWREVKEIDIHYIDPWPRGYWHSPYYRHRGFYRYHYPASFRTKRMPAN